MNKLDELELLAHKVKNLTIPWDAYEEKCMDTYLDKASPDVVLNLIAIARAAKSLRHPGLAHHGAEFTESYNKVASKEYDYLRDALSQLESVSTDQ